MGEGFKVLKELWEIVKTPTISIYTSVCDRSGCFSRRAEIRLEADLGMPVFDVTERRIEEFYEARREGRGREHHRDSVEEKNRG